MTQKLRQKTPLSASVQALGQVFLLLVLCGWMPGETVVVFGPKTYIRHSGDPIRVKDAFTVRNPNARFRLLITNSRIDSKEDDNSKKKDQGTDLHEYDREHRGEDQNCENGGISRAKITLNGLRIVDPDDFGHKVSTLSIPVKLLPSNRIEVEVLGPKDGKITVEIEAVEDDVPSIQATVSPKPNSAGWSNTNVTVTFLCTDPSSGIASCSPSQTVTQEGANQIISGTARNTSGNTASTSVTLNIDKTPPAITASQSPPANASGWNNSAVTVTFTCNDSLSGIANCPAPVTVNDEISNKEVSGTAQDVAGNTASASRIVNLDKTPPTLTITSPADNTTVTSSALTVTGQVSDALSGVGSVTCNGTSALLQGETFTCPLTLNLGQNSIAVQAFDNAGNAVTKSETIAYAPPVISFLTPSTGQQGQKGLSVAITGQFAHFEQGVTTANFGAGISFSSLTITSPTTAIAVLNIDAEAPSGQRDVTVTTGPEVITLASGFVVTPGTPVMAHIDPSSGRQGQQSLTLSITGAFTHFVQGTTQVNLGAGIVVSDVEVKSSTNLTAQVAIVSAASLGARDLTVTTGNEVLTLPEGFSILVANHAPIVSASTCTTTLTALSPQTFAEYASQSIVVGRNIYDLTIGPDCNIWFTETSASKIARVTPSGVLTEFPIPTIGGWPVGIAPGPDGNVWFTEAHGHNIGRISDDGVVTEFPVSGGVNLVRIITGPDGNLWFTDDSANLIERITPTGTITQFKVPTPNALPTTLAVGPDGAMWFTEQAGIGRITTSGVITEFAIPTPAGRPGVITAGPDGNLWFTEENGSQIGTINPTTTMVREFPVPTPGATPNGITLGPDGNLWFMEVDGDKLGRVTIDGAITEYSLPAGVILPNGISTGADGNLWFTAMIGGNYGVGKFNPSTGAVAVISLKGNVTDDGAPAGASLSTTWGTVSGPDSVTFSNPIATFSDIAGQANQTSTQATFTTPGTYVFSLTGSDSQLSGSANVTINVNAAPKPTILSASPNSGQQSQQNLSVIFTGQFTNWVQGETVADFGDGITVASLTVNTPTSATAVINISPSAILGSHNVTVTTGTEEVSLVGGFSISTGSGTCVPAASGLVGWWPGDGNANDIFGGDNGITTGGVTFAPAEVTQGFEFNGLDGLVTSPNTSATNITSDFTIAAWINPASSTNRGAIVAKGNGDDYANAYQLFYGNSARGASQDLLLSLSDGGTGASYFESAQGVSIPNGTFSHVVATVQGTTAALYINGTPIPGNYFHGTNRIISPATELTSNRFSDSGSLRIGARSGEFFFAGIVDEVSLYSRSLSAAEVNAIFAAGPAGSCKSGLPITPTLLSVSPNSAQQGQQNVNAALLGQFTHWSQGTTTASFGPGIAVASLVVDSPTSATATLTIAPSADIGVRTVTVTTGNETETLANGFTVAAGTPSIISVTPNAKEQGQQISVIITGQFTHFAQGISQVRLGPGINICSVTVTSATSLTAEISVSITAAPGVIPVAVQTGNEQVSLPNGFVILPATQTSASNWMQLSPSGTLPEALFTANNNHFFNPGTRRFAELNLGDTISVLSDPTALVGTPQWTTLTSLPDPLNGFPSALKTSSGGAGPSVYDGINNRLIMFGGCLGHCGSPTNEVWVLTDADGSEIGQTPSWVKLLPTGAPPPARWLHTAVYDAVSNSMTIFGGSNNGSGSTLQTFSDVWILSNANGLGGTPSWTQLAPIGGPPPGQVGASAVYDPSSRSMIVFGGALNGLGVASNAVWSLSNANGQGGTPVWTNLVAEGSPGSPPSRALHSAVYNVCSNQMTIFGGSLISATAGASDFHNDTWLLANANGLEGTPTWMELNPIGAVPPPRFNPAGMLDTASDRMTIFGGEDQNSVMNDTWVLSGLTGVPESLLTVTPGIAQQGQSLPVTLAGQLTNFQQGNTQLNFGTGITVMAVTVNSPTSVSAVLNIDPTATPGIRSVSATTGIDTVRLDGGFTVAAPTALVPSIVTVSPTSGQQEESGPVAVVGLNTHFVQGNTQVDFGPGITVSGITVSCATCLNAQLQISPTAMPGPRTVTATTGTEVVILANGFTVLPGTPILTSLVPAAGQQGQNLSVNITGQFTHFAQGTTQVNLGAGVTVSGLSISSPTSLTAQLSIDLAATVGTRTVTVTTGTEIVAVPNVFTIQQAIPILLTLNPGGGERGQTNLSVAITGQNTHFSRGTSQSNFGAGVRVTSFTVSGPTTATAIVNIDPTTTLGPRTVTVTTGSEVASFNNGFTVTAAVPKILSLDPGGSQQGRQNLSVAIVGEFTNWVQGTTTVNFGPGVAVLSLTVNSSSTATAVVNIDPTAVPGLRTVTMTTGSEVATFPNGFTVVAGTPALLSATPGSGQQGQQHLVVAVTGQFTHFIQGTTSANFGVGITVASLTVNSATNTSAVLNIDPAAPLGIRDVTFTTNSEVATLTGGFIVVTPTSTPVITALSPNSGKQGQQNLSVGVTGQFTHFAQGTTTVSFGFGVTVASLTVNSATTATAVINVDLSAVPGTRDVTVTTGAEVVNLSNGFTVNAGTPLLQQISPSTGQQGEQSLSVTITGAFTHFAQGTTSVTFGLGITVASLTVNSATNAVAVLDIDPAATLGTRNVVVTTGLEVVTLSNSFAVAQPTGPAIVSLAPNSALQGQSIQINVTALNTHFIQGTTRVNFGPQISVGGGVAGGYGPVQVTSPTTAIAQISVPNNAVLGPRTVVAQTRTEQADIINGFQITTAPYLAAINPHFAQRGQTISVTITGAFTNFQQGVSQCSFGAGISVGGAASGEFGPIAVTSPTTATALITIDSTASPGLRVVTVTTGTEEASLINNGFLVLGPVTGPGPVVSITSPTEGSEVTALTSVTGAVTSSNLANWTLEYEASGSTVFTQFATGNTSVVSGTLDPTLLLNGIAQIRLTGVDQSGQTTSAVVDVVVARNVKVGNFTLSFNDLTIPVAGLPIQIIRTYDSRNKSNGDFGFGWSLDVETTKIDVNGILGNSWFGNSSGGAFPTYCVQPTQNYVVSVRLPGGNLYQFAPMLNGGCQQLVPPSTVDMAFVPIGSTPQNASLTATGATNLFIGDPFPGRVQLFDQTTSQPFDPDQFTVTLPTGQQFQVSRTFGVQSVKDTNGNTLTITTSGITSSTGKGVSFARDAQNRITSITDPTGNILTYAYDVNGDFATFTNQVNDVSTFTYDGAHNLVSFKDPRGVQPLRNVYDDAGRLIQEIDAFGHVVNFTHDTAASTETVANFLGNPTTYVYDNHGNVVSTTDALGNITSATFDANDNETSRTNALGKTSTSTYGANNNRLSETDPLGHVTAYTYNSRNQVLTITDALGRVTTNTYDPSGNLLSTKDPASNLTSYAYNGQGLRTSMTDALGGVTGYQYDSSGNLTQQADPLGNVTSYSYDSNGNKLTETKVRTTSSGQETLTKGYQYDGLNRLTTTTYPDGSTTQIQYNAIGKQSATTDQLGRQTSYQYDLMGRLTQTTFPDGTTEAATYDADGNRIASTDRAGHSTTFVYDALKRLTSTTYADNAATSTTYDGVGQVTAVTDARGNTTQYQYDDAGRRTKVTDALSHATSFIYDSVGNQLSMTDANGHTTQYQYDTLNRRTATLHSDSTSDSVAYDALGRTVSKTDQAGQTTQFLYDKMGRLIQVTDALGHLTKYAYDEIGNRISQTDANNHTTRFAYDSLGRRTKRTLPLGMSETTTYNAAGNLVSKADFNGKTTTYIYDAMSRLLSKMPDASFAEPAIDFAYTPTGQRQTMTDATGTTSYVYDVRDRLTQKATSRGTLSYTYDAAGNLASIRSSNPNGTSVDYTYDVLNRLSTVQDNRLASGATTYAYDNAGNLQGYAYPNGVQTSFTYNALNRLTNVTVNKGVALASYAYQLEPAGNRTQVNELGGRQVSYTYDGLYRLTGETISGATISGAIGYQYDPVGNRLQRASTVAQVPPATYSYDANDRLTTDSYDPNGNTSASGASTFAYDFENRLISQNGGAVTIAYDGDGNRVSETTGGVTTNYLVDDRNLTGYAQVLEELSGGAVQRVYTYGLNRINQSQVSGTSFYGYDGQGNVRALTDSTGTITDRYDYDAFGSIISEMSTTSNSFLYGGEQFDETLGLTYLRARYLSTSKGRFLTQDTMRSDPENPLSINRFPYAFNQPTELSDPSGLWPTETHNFILESAFEGFLPTQDIETLKQVSANQDSPWMGGQDWTRSYEHHMRDGFHHQSEDVARSLYQQFITSNLTGAQTFEASGNHEAALQLLGKNFHALADGTSPAHSCVAAQLYEDFDKAPECGNSTEDFRPWQLSVVVRHHFEEADTSDFGIAAAIDIVRNHYLQNFRHSGLSFLPARPIISVESLDAFPELGSILVTTTLR